MNLMISKPAAHSGEIKKLIEKQRKKKLASYPKKGRKKLNINIELKRNEIFRNILLMCRKLKSKSQSTIFLA